MGHGGELCGVEQFRVFDFVGCLVRRRGRPFEADDLVGHDVGILARHWPRPLILLADS